MISYIKTQWFPFAVGIANLVISISNLIDGDYLFCVAWFMTAMVWWFSSVISYHNDRIELLEKKAEKYDALVAKVDALQELLKTESKYSDHLNKKIESLVYVVEGKKK